MATNKKRYKSLPNPCRPSLPLLSLSLSLSLMAGPCLEPWCCCFVLEMKRWLEYNAVPSSVMCINTTQPLLLLLLLLTVAAALIHSPTDNMKWHNMTPACVGLDWIVAWFVPNASNLTLLLLLRFGLETYDMRVPLFIYRIHVCFCCEDETGRWSHSVVVVGGVVSAKAIILY